jgi:hypothetical protein
MLLKQHDQNENQKMVKEIVKAHMTQQKWKQLWKNLNGLLHPWHTQWLYFSSWIYPIKPSFVMQKQH